MTRPPPISAVAFDLDDTLYPESDFVIGGYRAASDAVQAARGVDIFPQLTRRFAAGERGDLFTPTLQQMECYEGEIQVKSLVESYRGHSPKLTPFDDVLPALGRLRGKVGLGLITDGIAAVQRRKLLALGLEKFFDVILITDELGREYWKPHARAFQEAARLLNCPVSEMVYVGDNPRKDFVGARALGMPTIRLRRPGTLHAALEPEPGFEADIEVVGLADAIAALLPRLRQKELRE